MMADKLLSNDIDRVRLLGSVLKSTGVETATAEMDMAIFNGLSFQFPIIIATLNGLCENCEQFIVDIETSALLPQ